MASKLKNLLVMLAAFAGGIISIHVIFEPVTLEEISANPLHFDGRRVEFETYAQTGPDAEIWLGQPFEKRELPAFIRSDSNLRPIETILVQNFTEGEYNRIKVFARGIINDNCSHGIPCCFGQSVTLSEAEITPVGPVERYSPPIY